MPRLSDATWRDRRQHVLVSAWKCFSRQGFHATSMDDVIAETGLSTSSVYRYFRSKDELIDAAGEESLAQTYAALAGLIDGDDIPSPADALAALIDALRTQQLGDYDLSKISMVAWSEALRRPSMYDFAHRFYGQIDAAFTALGRRWVQAGILADDADPQALARLLVTLMPGLIVTSHLYETPDVETLVAGIYGFASSSAPGRRSSGRPTVR